MTSITDNALNTNIFMAKLYLLYYNFALNIFIKKVSKYYILYRIYYTITNYVYNNIYINTLQKFDSTTFSITSITKYNPILT